MYVSAPKRIALYNWFSVSNNEKEKFIYTAVFLVFAGLTQCVHLSVVM